MRYSELRKKLKTGDIVLFSGKGRVSRWIKIFCWVTSFFKRCAFSHVGMIVKVKDKIMIYESTSIRGGTKGVRLVPFSQVYADYEGEIWIRKLRSPLSIGRQSVLAKHIQENLGKGYEKDILELMGSAWDGWITGKNEPDMTTVFCSELIADFLIKAGLIHSDIPANERTPQDFACGGDDEIDVLYEKEYQIK